MEQHRTHGFLNFNIEPIEIFARQCDVTGEGMNKGFCLEEGNMYIKHEKDLVAYLRKNFETIIEGHADFDEDIYDISMDPVKLNDDEVMEACHEADYYYYTEWTADDACSWYVTVQKAAHMMLQNDFDVHIVAERKLALTAWNSRLDLTTEVYVQPSDIEEWAHQYDEMTKTEQS